jgi:hypothetical protein
VNLVPLTRGLLEAIDAHMSQRGDISADSLTAPTGHSFAAIVDGKPIAAAGVIELWQSRGHCWALMGKDAGPHMLAITRATRAFLATAPFRRLEMAVDVNNWPAIRWAEMLGFECESVPMRGYAPDGRSCLLYAKVKG